jgi:hypothetical protein
MEIEVKKRLPSSIIGFTVGLLMGFTSSPVVGSVISSILAATFVLLSLAPNASKVKIDKSHYSAVCYFSVFIALGAMFSLYVKSELRIFPAQVQIEYMNLLDIGINEEIARSAVLSRYSNGANLSPVTELKGNGTIDANQLGRIADANVVILETIENMDSSPSKATIKTQATTIAYRIRDVIESEIDQKTAIAWFELHTAPRSERLNVLNKLQTDNKAEYEKIVEFFNGKK